MKVMDEFADMLWEALRRRCCSDPANAKRIVMFSRDDLDAALSAIYAAQGTEARRAEATDSACDGPVPAGDAPCKNTQFLLNSDGKLFCPDCGKVL